MTFHRLFTSIALVLLLVGWGLPAEAQMICTHIGKFISCDAPKGRSTTQLDLGQGMGVITDERGNVEPYAILTPNVTRPSTVPAPLAPQPPAPPSFSTGDLYDVLQPPTTDMLFMPLSLGDAGP